MAENHALIPEPVTMYTDKMKEVKHLSENLVSGDFERQFRDNVMAEKPGRKTHCSILLGVCIAALAIWVLTLTVLREVQITRLRNEVDELTANMIAMEVTVKSLNQKLANNRMFNEFKNLEDTIYADDDESIAEHPKIEDDLQNYPSLDKLQGLTVLEDDNMGDDEDIYDDDDDDAESGDWYQEYDRRRAKVGTTTMVRLKPEDFTDTELTIEKKAISNIGELKRMLNENPENPDISFSSLAAKEAPDAARNKRSVFPDAPSASQSTVPEIVSKDERRKTKKFNPSADSPAKLSMHAVTRTVRSDNEGQRRPFIAAHFHGNTSHLHTETHEHYKGNGLVRVSHGSPHDVWYPSDWTRASPHPRPTLTRTGHIHVRHTGVYLVYVQIYYLDSHDIISWVLHRTNPETEGRETLLQCAQSSHSAEPQDKPNSCFSSSALFLKAGDKLAVRNTGGDRHSLMQQEKSFIGLIKLADAEDPNEEY